MTRSSYVRMTPDGLSNYSVCTRGAKHQRHILLILFLSISQTSVNRTVSSKVAHREEDPDRRQVRTEREHVVHKFDAKTAGT